MICFFYKIKPASHEKINLKIISKLFLLLNRDEFMFDIAMIKELKSLDKLAAPRCQKKVFGK